MRTSGERRLVYFVSRFPVTSETFIVRELDAIAAVIGAEVELRSLFPAPDTVVHGIAAKWVGRLVRPRLFDALRGVGWAMIHRPRALLRVGRVVVAEYRHKPALLIRALTTVALACSHARDLSAQSPAPHVHAHYASYPALAAWVCRQLIGSTYSFTAHAHDLYVDKAMLARKVRDAEFVATISDYNRTLLKEVDGGPTPIEVVHCGIETARYPYRARDVPTIGPISALTVASLQEYKGHAVLLRALALDGEPVQRVELDLIGDGPLRGDLEQLAEELGVAHRVRFLGSRDEDHVRDALATADLFVLPSVVAADGQMEGLPVALMEALASGVPTVSTALSGIPEIVIDQVTGHLAQAGDVDDMHRALTEVICSHRRSMSEDGRALVLGEFDLNDAAAQLHRLLAACLTGG